MLTQDTSLYYEAHITIEPVEGDRRERCAAIAQGFRFKLAELLMRKRSEDTEERSKDDSFMTAHSQNLADIRYRTAHAVWSLQQAGFKVWRYKIEETLCDSRQGDEFNLLPAQPAAPYVLRHS